MAYAELWASRFGPVILDYGGPIVQDTRFEATWAKVRYGASTPKWMSYRRQVVQDARRSRPSHSRSEVLSLNRSDHGAVRQRPGIPIRREDHRSRDQSTSTDVLYRRLPASRSLHPACEGRHYRINSPRDSPIGLVVL